MNHKPLQIPTDDFVRRFSMRTVSLMWFLGAGASASAGVPTAMDMIWQFKRSLFVSQSSGASGSSVDLSQPAMRSRIDAHIKSIDGMPLPGAPNEYAVLFEAAYPAEADRRTVLDAALTGAKPSYGHMALATLMRHHLVRLVWTTNFDALIEDACAKVFDTTSALTTIDLESATSAHHSIADERWPIEVKLHGDFRFRRLKNTADELRQQDAHLRSSFVDSCKRHGLVVCGYSGRDDSIMDALGDAVEHHGSFPSGLFWLHRGEDPPMPRVTSLLDRGIRNGIEAAMIRIENFDEILRDLVRIVEAIDTSALDQFMVERSPWSPAPRFVGVGRGWPVVRLNAMPLTRVPTQCRRLVCDVAGTAEVRELVQSAGRDVLAVRSGVGVLAFGADSDVRAVFESRGIVEFDLHPFDIRRQRYESTERGLLGEALNRAMERHRGLTLVNRQSLVPARPEDPEWRPLEELVGPLTGVVTASPNLRWHEGITVRLSWANDQLWLLVEPRTVFGSITDANRMVAADFARERTVRRYNSVLNALIEFWAHHLSQEKSDMRALNTQEGVDAVFQLSSVTAFSRRRTP